MKRILLMLLVATAGTGVGGGAAVGAAYLMGMGPSGAAPDQAFADSDMVFEDIDPILAPLVLPDGRLAGYASFKIALEIPADKVDFVRARLPMMLHAINLRTYRVPMASGPDGMIPNLAPFRAVVTEAAPQAFGPGVVRRVAIVQATPA